MRTGGEGPARGEAPDTARTMRVDGAVPPNARAASSIWTDSALNMFHGDARVGRARARAPRLARDRESPRRIEYVFPRGPRGKHQLVLVLVGSKSRNTVFLLFGGFDAYRLHRVFENAPLRLLQPCGMPAGRRTGT